MSDDALPFADCRILDLTEDGRMLCGKILADLGADVIAIEPPGGQSLEGPLPFTVKNQTLRKASSGLP